jgi:hypothetical protein
MIVHLNCNMDPGASKEGMAGKGSPSASALHDDNDSTADEDDELDDHDDDEEGGQDYGERELSASGGRLFAEGGEIARKRREKRLAMNRASARARRKRKKVLLDSFSGQVNDLTKKNQELQSENDRLRCRAQQLESAVRRAQQLESAVQQAQATIAALIPSAGNSMATRQPQAASAAQSQQEVFRSLLLAMTSSLNPSMNASIAAPSGLSLVNFPPSPAPTVDQILAAAQANQLIAMSQGGGCSQLLSNPSALLGFNQTTGNLLSPGVQQQHQQQQQQLQQQNALNTILAQAKSGDTVSVGLKMLFLLSTVNFYSLF